MHYNLNNKNQRKKFWKDCEKAVIKCKDVIHSENHTWENGRRMVAIELFNFWRNDEVFQEECVQTELISKNVMDTFDYYYEYGSDELEGFYLY